MTDVHSTALVADTVKLGRNVTIGPYCCVDGNVVLGDNCRLDAHVVVTGDTSIGADTRIFPFASIGHISQDLKYDGELVSLEIGARNTIREHVTMNPGTSNGGAVTRVGDDNLFMVGVHVAHDCVVGSNVIMANNATLGGHVSVADFAILGGLVGVHQFSRIGAHSFVGAGSLVTEDVIPFGMVSGNRAILGGLNLVGLKRRDFDRNEINALRAAYKDVFMTQNATFQDRVLRARETYAESGLVNQMIDFILVEKSRGYCLPSPSPSGA
ncbi:MAG: acyl-[acyl-carrier-protein]--UDP-N-acetylglucosamine O-acyltransferase [Rhodobiaceae bacterium]|nr:acyl-[acyl-carrier-protein]--UDP-N-acetylglucosamine O-acyltransferase [Rhodobiaceae bacterium]OUT92664.1 MAG: acyl-[acyl-carrier-protein]--UDP-N-acetylglucosamine O-acyltransferase [Rhizobiales bacterium TMED29]